MIIEVEETDNRYSLMYDNFNDAFEISGDIDAVENFKTHQDIKNIFSKDYKFLYKEDIDYLLDKYKKERLINIKNLIRKEFPDVPLISIENNLVNKLTLNPKLKGKFYQEYVPGEIIYQEIEMFLNKLNCIEKDVKIDDNTKIKSHGFNSCSFKKCKKDNGF